MATIIGVAPITVTFTSHTLLTIVHDLGYKPSLDILDSEGVVMGSPYVKHATDKNSFSVSFAE